MFQAGLLKWINSYLIHVWSSHLAEFLARVRWFSCQFSEWWSSFFYLPCLGPGSKCLHTQRANTATRDAGTFSVGDSEPKQDTLCLRELSNWWVTLPGAAGAPPRQETESALNSGHGNVGDTNKMKLLTITVLSNISWFCSHWKISLHSHH